VLDVACGTGNVAIALARQGALVTGLDIAGNLLVQARERAANENLKVTFDEGDAEQLPYLDAAFDVVVSMFGAMFAPRPEIVTSEFARVLKPGGRLAMANWPPDGFTGEMFEISRRHAVPPPGIASPLLWGDETTVRARLASNFTDVRTELVPIDFAFPFDSAGTVEFFRKYFGPTHVAFNSLDEAGQAALAADLNILFSKENVDPDPINHTVVPSEYLQVTASRIGLSQLRVASST
jgi:SAM-dependent methyltransferase